MNPSSNFQVTAYHGTNYGPIAGDYHTEPEEIHRRSGGDINALLGAHFAGDREVAEGFARGWYQVVRRGDQPYIEEVVLRLACPWRTTEDGLNSYIEQVRENVDMAGIDPEDEVAVARAVKDGLTESGYDSVIYENQVEGGTAYIVFHPTQIISRKPL